jgi:nucleotide-binding universal stress UspA family protein
MWDIEPRRVLVAVESAECDAALMYAAQEAHERRCGVHVIHVLPAAFGAGPYVDSLVLSDGDLRIRGRDLLAEAAGRLERLVDHDELTVSTELCHGAVVPTLVHESSSASLVVLQHKGMGPHGRTPVLSVTLGVAARSYAPVVAVPAGWQSLRPDLEPIVTIGVGDDRENDHLVDVAAAEALRMGALLRIVHAGDYLSLHDLVTEIPEIPFKYVNSLDEPAEALLACALDTALFVVGRRHPRLPLGQHLGPVARTLLRRSPVPVMVVDPGREDESEGGRDLATSVVP